jgi:acetate kinase
MLMMTVNAGSTSVRLGLFERVGDRIQKRLLLRRNAAPGEEAEALAAFLTEAVGDIAVIIHRVVHAGADLRTTCRFDDDVRRGISRAIPWAPLHNPPTLAWADACRERLPKALQLAAFDSGFFRDLPAVATTYGLPAKMAARAGITRLGFHGLAHQSMSEAFHAFVPHHCGRVISLQLGGGCSVTALRRGVPVDTSMGATPLEGLMMATRPGDLDPGAALQLLEEGACGRDGLRRVFNEESGLRGVSGMSGDIRELLDSDAPSAQLALDVFCYRIRKYVGAYWAVLGGCDAILIGGGAGEGSAALRARIFTGLACLGAKLDAALNAQAVAPARISASDSAVDLWVLPTDEESILAREASAWLGQNPDHGSP